MGRELASQAILQVKNYLYDKKIDFLKLHGEKSHSIIDLLCAEIASTFGVLGFSFAYIC